MKTLKKVPGHTRLYRRGAVYYHRASIPTDIADTYPKTEETFSLKTKDHVEAVRLVRIEAVKVDQKFDAHRRMLARQSAPALDELTADQIAHVKAVYYGYRLDEDEDSRLEGFDEFEDIVVGSEVDEEGNQIELTERVFSEPKTFNPRPTFDEYVDLVNDMDSVTRHELARGKKGFFYLGEAEEVLSWDGNQSHKRTRASETQTAPNAHFI